MSHEKWIVLTNIPFEISPIILKGLFEANQIPVILSKESAADVIGITIGPIGDTEVLIPESKESEARSILENYYNS